MNQPLVSVGMPVRNGGAMFEAALNAILEQDYPNIEIIISDNASSDSTAAFCASVTPSDPRIRYFRQQRMLDAFSNLNFVLDEAQGEFFLWAAHDDLRSTNFISEQVGALLANTGSVLAFGDLRISTVHGSAGTATAYDFENCGLPPVKRLRKQALMQCFHIYGLWRTASLRTIPKIYCPWWFDLPLMMAASQIGSFIYVPGVTFISLDVPKTDAERSRYQDGRKASSKILYVLQLLENTYRVVRPVASLHLTIAGVLFVAEKNIGFAMVGAKRRLQRLISPTSVQT